MRFRGGGEAAPPLTLPPASLPPPRDCTQRLGWEVTEAKAQARDAALLARAASLLGSSDVAAIAAGQGDRLSLSERLRCDAKAAEGHRALSHQLAPLFEWSRVYASLPYARAPDVEAVESLAVDAGLAMDAYEAAAGVGGGERRAATDRVRETLFALYSATVGAEAAVGDTPTDPHLVDPALQPILREAAATVRLPRGVCDPEAGGDGQTGRVNFRTAAALGRLRALGEEATASAQALGADHTTRTRRRALEEAESVLTVAGHASVERMVCRLDHLRLLVKRGGGGPKAESGPQEETGGRVAAAPPQLSPAEAVVSMVAAGSHAQMQEACSTSSDAETDSEGTDCPESVVESCDGGDGPGQSGAAVHDPCSKAAGGSTPAEGGARESTAKRPDLMVRGQPSKLLPHGFGASPPDGGHERPSSKSGTNAQSGDQADDGEPCSAPAGARPLRRTRIRPTRFGDEAQLTEAQGVCARAARATLLPSHCPLPRSLTSEASLFGSPESSSESSDGSGNDEEEGGAWEPASDPEEARAGADSDSGISLLEASSPPAAVSAEQLEGSGCRVVVQTLQPDTDLRALSRRAIAALERR